MPTPTTATDAVRDVRVPAPRRWRVGVLRIALALAAPIVLFGGLELGLRLCGVGHSTAFFVADTKPGYVRTNPHFAELFFPPSFGMRANNFRMPRVKPAGALRVFVVGESATKGTPEPAFGFVAQLRAQLRARHPEREIEVYNLGITAINSHVVDRIVREAAGYEPDLFVVYVGNNEVVGPYGPGSAYRSQMPPRWAIRASVALRATRTGQWLRSLLARAVAVDPKQAEWRGMQMFADKAVRATDPRLAAVYANFQANLEDIVQVAKSAGARVVLSTVVANLKDSAPFISRHSETLAAPDLARFDRAFRRGMQHWTLGDHDAARAAFAEAVAIDPEYADAHFMLGRVAEGLGDGPTARREYSLALHWDALRFRPDEPINATIRSVASRAGSAVTLVDTADLLGSAATSAAPIAGSELLFEHVHFNWHGNYRVATLLAAAAERQLFGAESRRPWLTESECGAAVGYTPYGQLQMLRTIGELTERPPFTGQLTFAEAQTRHQAERETLEAALKPRAALDACAAQIARAEAADPNNGQLPVLREDVDIDRGALDDALAAAARAEQLQPTAPELLTQQACVLQLLHRNSEAEALLRHALENDPTYFPACDVLVSAWVDSGNFSVGAAFFDAYTARFPHNNYVRLAYADLCRRTGHWDQAEVLWRAIFSDDPGNETALGNLIGVLEQRHEADAALQLMLAGYERQPRDFANDRRLARHFLEAGNTAQAVKFLRATEASGPVSATFHVELARQLAAMNDPAGTALELLQGRRAALAEGNAEQVARIDALLRIYPPPDPE